MQHGTAICSIGVAWRRRLRQNRIPRRFPVAKGRVQQSKSNKPKLTAKEKAAKKKAKQQAKGG